MRWPEFVASTTDLASSVARLLYQYEVGLAFLATVRRDGGPRVHPFCPVIADDGLYGFLIPSPKRDDLIRDARYAMHSFPADENEDAAYLTGRAVAVRDPSKRERVERQFLAERMLLERPRHFDQQDLFEFDVERCLYTKTTGHGDPDPIHEIWTPP
jgi:hypothetical protein